MNTKESLLNTWVFRLIIINAVVYFFQSLYGNVLIVYFGLIPSYVVNEGYIWQVFTYMFLHGSFLHIFFNMYILFLFGMAIEQLWGPGRFLFYYFFTGIGSGLTILVVNLFIFGAGYNVPTIGASGAVFGILLAFGILFPKTELYLLFIPVPIKARTLVIFYAGITVLLLIFTGAGSTVSHTGHLGGLIFGVIYFLILRRHSIKFASKKGVAKFKDEQKERPHLSEGLSGTKDVEKLKNIFSKVQSGGGQNLTDDDIQFVKYMAIMREADDSICEDEDFDIKDRHCSSCESIEACLIREIKKHI